MSGAAAAGELATRFVALNEYLFAGGDRDTALQRLIDLAALSVPGCEWAAITAWPIDRSPRSLATSDRIASDVDDLQYRFREGPCLTAAADSEMTRIVDLSGEQRWPRFAAAVVAETPVRSALSFHLVDEPDRSALNLYGDRAGAFDTDAVTVASLFAAHARVLLLHSATGDKAANLTQALTTSRQIGTAIGILMNVHKVTAEAAFDLLKTSSQHLHRKLHDIAEEVTETGALPQQPAPSASTTG